MPPTITRECRLVESQQASQTLSRPALWLISSNGYHFFSPATQNINHNTQSLIRSVYPIPPTDSQQLAHMPNVVSLILNPPLQHDHRQVIPNLLLKQFISLCYQITIRTEARKKAHSSQLISAAETYANTLYQIIENKLQKQAGYFCKAYPTCQHMIGVGVGNIQFSNWSITNQQVTVEANFYMALLMPKLAGTTLAQLYGETTLTMQQFTLLAKSILAAITELSEKGIRHGDISPNNLLIQITDSGAYQTKPIDLDFATDAHDGKLPIVYNDPENAYTALFPPDRLTDNLRENGTSIQAKEHHDAFPIAGIFLWLLDKILLDNHCTPLEKNRQGFAIHLLKLLLRKGQHDYQDLSLRRLNTWLTWFIQHTHQEKLLQNNALSNFPGTLMSQDNRSTSPLQITSQSVTH